MCGIYGYIGKPTNSEKILDLFIDLGIETESRGTHATGYYGVNDQAHMKKAPLKATEFYLETKQFYDFYENVPTVMIGHNRWASCGDPKVNANNHPFINERFGFIHNGCAKGWVNFKSLGITCETDCDSEWIFKSFLKTLELHHNNIVSAIKKTLKVFDDATVACAMVDSKTKKLWLFRNIGNPICYTILKDQKTLVFASTPTILADALLKHEIVAEKIVEVEKGQIISIDEDLNIEKETASFLRGPRTSYLTTVTNNWRSSNISYLPKPEKKKGIVSSGYKCLKCGKKYISIKCVEEHLLDYHRMDEKLDEDEDLDDYWEDLSKPQFGFMKKTINRKADFKVVKKASFKVIKTSQVTPEPDSNRKLLPRTYSSFEDMQKDTERILKELEAMPT